MEKFLPRFWAWIHADKERDLAEQVSKMESSEFLNFSFESDSSSDQPVDAAYVKHYKWLKGEEHVVIYLWLSLRAEFIFTSCIFVQGPTVTKVMTWSSSVDEKKGWNLKWINLQSFRATFVQSSIGFYLFGSQKFVNEFGLEWVWEQCFSIPSTVNAKNSNKFDYNRLVSSVPPSLSVPTTQPALIEWQNTICMPPSPPKILRQKAKRNCYGDSTRATNETPEFLSFDYWNWAWARMQTFYFFQVYFKQLFDLNTIYWL